MFRRSQRQCRQQEKSHTYHSNSLHFLYSRRSNPYKVLAPKFLRSNHARRRFPSPLRRLLRPHRPPLHPGERVNTLYIVSGTIAAALLVYLTFALLKPEKF